MFKKLMTFLGKKAAEAQRAEMERNRGGFGGAEESTEPKPRPIHVTDQDFQEKVLESGKLAVVDFWAEWCGPCHVMAPNIDYLAEDYHERVVVAKLDVDANPATPQKYGIMGIPTLIFYFGGQEVDRHVGIMHFEQLTRKVDELLAQHAPQEEGS